MAEPRDYPRVELLGRAHDRSSFNSGAAELDRYLIELASQDARRRTAAVFVAVDSNAVVGYYSLAAYAIELAELPEHLTRRLPRYPLIPATLLGRLAVDTTWQGRGLGEYLLLDALFRSLRNEIASYAVVVEARDENAERFYQKYGFRQLQRRRLFLPMATIAQIAERLGK